MGRAQLRKRTLHRHKHRCMLSGFNNVHELETAHIVPQSITKALKNFDNNVFILNSGLHSLFDKFRWTFDLFEFIDKPVIDEHHFYCRIMSVDNPEKSSLQHVSALEHQIPIIYLPYLYLHYCIYLKVNYTVNADVVELYQQYMDSSLYKELLTVKTVTQAQNLLKSQRNLQYDVIVNDQSNLFHVAWSLYPRSTWTWEPKINIVGQGFDDYQSFINHKKYVVSV